MNLTLKLPPTSLSWNYFYGAAAVLLVQTLLSCSFCISGNDDPLNHGLFPTTNAWIRTVTPLPIRRQRTDTYSSSYQHRLNAFLWFGGGDDNNNDNNNDDNKGSKDWSQYSLWSTNNDNDATTTTTTTANNNMIDNNNLRSISQVMDTKLGSFKSSQKVGDKMTAILTELANTFVEGYSSSEGSNKYKNINNKVKVIFNGQQVPIRVQIDEQYIQELFLTASSSALPSKSPTSSNTAAAAAAGIVEELNLAITTAMIEAHTKSSQKLQDKLKGVYQDLGFF
jgi:DNA-binding protein YbaB